MLIRPTTDQTFECTLQEHHALISGVLAGAWAPSRLDALLVQAIGIHDNPWREADANPVFDAERRLPHDFITYPMEAKIALYRRGIDQLETVHPWVAYLVSRHYTTFSGTRDVDALQRPETARRARLEAMLSDARVAASDEGLRWIKFFDVFSLHLCLTGPRTQPGSVPRWLTDPDAWSTAPDGTELRLRWSDDTTLTVAPWPFVDDSLRLSLYHRRLDDRPQTPAQLAQAWAAAPIVTRAITLRQP